jgi:hypothetical protein
LDFGVMIGFISVSCGAVVLGLSYLGAYLLGHSRGRREAEMELRQREAYHDDRVGHADRILMVEGAVSSMADAINRLTEAQRLALFERMRDPQPNERISTSRTPTHNTPS